MNSDHSWSREDSLDALLQMWRMDIPLPPRFQANVWRRIVREEARTEAVLWQRFSRWVQTVLSHRGAAMSYVAILMFAGLTSGYFHAQRESAQATSRWQTIYVQSVDPYQAPRD
jgi:hypothetical protein